MSSFLERKSVSRPGGKRKRVGDRGVGIGDGVRAFTAEGAESAEDLIDYLRDLSALRDAKGFGALSFWLWAGALFAAKIAESAGEWEEAARKSLNLRAWAHPIFGHAVCAFSEELL